MTPSQLLMPLAPVPARVTVKPSRADVMLRRAMREARAFPSRQSTYRASGVSRDRKLPRSPYGPATATQGLPTMAVAGTEKRLKRIGRKMNDEEYRLAQQLMCIVTRMILDT
jgi:hypothetical protein